MDTNLFKLTNALEQTQTTYQTQLTILDQLEKHNVDAAVRILYNREKFDKFLNQTYIFDAKNAPHFIKDMVLSTAAHKFFYYFISEFKQLSLNAKTDFISNVEQYLESLRAEQSDNHKIISNTFTTDLTDEAASKIIKTTTDSFDSYDYLYMTLSDKIKDYSADIKGWFNQHVLVVDMPNGDSEFSINF